MPGGWSCRRLAGGSRGTSSAGRSCTRGSRQPVRGRRRASPASSSTPGRWPDGKLVGVNVQLANPTTKQINKQNKPQEEISTICSIWAHHARGEADAEALAVAEAQVEAEEQGVPEEQVAAKRRKVEPAALSALSAPRLPRPPTLPADPCIDDWICALTELGVVFDAWIVQDLKQLHDADRSAGACLVHRMQRDLFKDTVRAPHQVL